MRGVSMTDDTDLIVAQAKGSGASGIKLYADLSAELAAKIISSAREQQFPVWAHAAVIPASPQDLASAGIQSLSHATLLAWATADSLPATGMNRYAKTKLNSNSAAFQALLKTMAEHTIYLEPTLNVYAKKDDRYIYDNGVKATQAAVSAGVPIIAGTDAVISLRDFRYPALIDEMIALAEEGGMSPMAVIKSATINPARLLNIDDITGSVEPGKKASFIILKGNPVDDLRVLKSPYEVWKNGQKL